MSSSDSEDDLISYGTPLEPLEEDEIPNKKPRLLEDQVVKDKQGRRRFHGAFTGGFSAGFYNTVGSLEGWTPSVFKSSKSKKQEIFQQKPEDFMDEEDVSEFGIAPLVLKAKHDYTVEKKNGRAYDFSESPALGTYVLEDLFKPVRETIGIKLLKKMGWKPGQGVGPRLTKSQKKESLKIRQKTYGCQLPPGKAEEKEEVDSNSDSEWGDIEFAPSDYEPILYEARTNFCGLGYQGLDKRLILSANSSKNNHNTVAQNKTFASQAFGVGAFEEEDEDIYARDDMSRYDFSLGNDQCVEGNKSPGKKPPSPSGIIEGFTRETAKRLRKNYPMPTLPKNFKPRHRIRISRFDDNSPNSKEKILKGPRLNSEIRKKLVEDSSEAIPVRESKKGNETLVKELITHVKLTGNKFKPFSSNPEKQDRYESYLKLIQIGKKELLNDLQPFLMSDWDRERERIEFEKAASLFKPLTGEMGDRFLTASQPDDLSDPLAVVEKFHDEKDELRKAAKMNMFGPLTRKTEDWIPEKLLCKRFNIPEPSNSSTCRSQQKPRKTTAKPSFNLFDAVQDTEPTSEKVEKDHDSEDSHNEKTEEKKSEINENLDDFQNIPNKADLFKAIFLASEDDDDGDDDGENRKDDLKENELKNPTETKENFLNLLYEEKVINSKRNMSPPSGIFQNIDFEFLSSAKKKPVPQQSEETQENKFSPSDLVYGPKIPENALEKIVAVTTESLPDDGLWVEKKAHTKKHKKKDKKNKKSSRKLKRKHKKQKR